LHGECGAGGVLRVADVDPGGESGNFDTLTALSATVAALDPDKRRRGTALYFSVHLSPNSFSMKARDSLGVRACARMIP
jgi:hypothetical protein